MTSQIKDPGAHTKQADGYRGDAAAEQIRKALARVRSLAVQQRRPAQPEPEEEPWR